MEDRGAVDDHLGQRGKRGLHGDDRRRGDGEVDPAGDRQPRQRAPGRDEEDAAGRCGEQGDPQGPRGGGQRSPVAPVRQGPVPVDEVVGHRVGADLVAVLRLGRPPAHHAAHVAVGDVGVVDLVVDPGSQYGADIGRQHREQQRRQHPRVQHRQHATGGDHTDQRGHQPLRVGDHDVRTDHAHLRRLVPFGEPVLRVRRGFHPAHRLDQRRVGLRGQPRSDPPLRVRGHRPRRAHQCGSESHHQQRRQGAAQPLAGGAASEDGFHGLGGGGQHHGCRDTRDDLASEEELHGPPVRPPGQVQDAAQDGRDLRAHPPEGDLGERIDRVLPAVDDLRGRWWRRRGVLMLVRGGRGQRGPPSWSSGVVVRFNEPGRDIELVYLSRAGFRAGSAWRSVADAPTRLPQGECEEAGLAESPTTPRGRGSPLCPNRCGLRSRPLRMRRSRVPSRTAALNEARRTHGSGHDVTKRSGKGRNRRATTSVNSPGVSRARRSTGDA